MISSIYDKSNRRNNHVKSISVHMVAIETDE